MTPGFDVPGALCVARRRIEAAGGDPDAVRVVAVTKGFGPDAVAAAASAGICDIGENFAQELLRKARDPAVPAGIRWHFLGAVQRNKVKALAPVVGCWQAVAREVEGEAIARRDPDASVLVEVALTGDPGRNGCRPGDAEALVGALRRMGLDVLGLMGVAPVGDGARPAFRTVRDLADRLGLPERSMGMSDDLEDAVAEGATMVRLGRALFGDRPPRPGARPGGG